MSNDLAPRIKKALATATENAREFFRDVYEWSQRAAHSLSRTMLTKYLLVTSAIIIVSFIIFGVILAGIVSERWEGEKQEQLADNVSGIAHRAGNYITPQTNTDGSTGENFQFSAATAASLQASMAVIGQSVGADIFLLDAQNNVLLCAEEDAQTIVQTANAAATCKHRDAMPEAFVTAALTEAARSPQGEYRSTGTLGLIYDEEQFIVGVPIITKDSNGDDVVVGMAIAVSTAKSVKEFQSEIANLALFSIIVASLISFVAVYLITYQQVRPLREMATAVTRFAGGDFEVRVPVTDETEVGQLAGAFNDMARSLASSETMRRSFIANISHELKTPMTTISGFVDGILDGTIPKERHNHYLSVVSSETKRLARLVRSMLDLSRIDSGELKLNKTKFDLSKTVTSTLFSFEHMIEEKQIDVQGMENIRPMYVYGDPDMLHQVVYNLLENAVKFTNVGGYINIKVYSRERDVYVRIANSGIGIPSEELPHVFERFYKTDKSRSEDKTGVGLGLYIVKTIVALHGGGIEARSSEGSYCEFEFFVPATNRD